ncbi:hypothetical protein MTR67_002848 [Solanum verrucosum]|uniref:Uncharacterized protein n=1 Tax=Solanum verrucosum TaxID=315347 RepID=A0AAF0PQZ4_SOLVR|nr:hypothetical protein MTR67_002848 [Solanum verrucosum]
MSIFGKFMKLLNIKVMKNNFMTCCILYLNYQIAFFTVFIVCCILNSLQNSCGILLKFEFFRCNLYLFCRWYSFQIMYMFNFVLYYRTIDK